ncbi:DUF6350 family protein [Amycolatopsis sp. NPDC059657]|uniref:cell division protein PerM n=1 Tax=Amycolatopsis sp. NPDC059657 TaxID=3346899 RepID=UPI003670D696
MAELLTPEADEWSDVDEPVAEPSPSARLRVLLFAALAPLVTGYALVATLLALITVSAERARFTVIGVVLSAGPGWLASYQVPVDIGGKPLGVLPLLPTIGLAVLNARTAGGAAQRLGLRSPREAVPVVVVIGFAHATLGVLIALIADGKQVGVNAFTAFAVPGVVAAVAATAGLAKRCGMLEVAAEYLDPLALRGLRAGALGMAALFAAGAVTFTLSLALSWSTVDDLFEPAFGSSLGLFLLSLGYLPNAIVAALSFASGPGFSLGSVTVTPFGFSGGAVPGVPLLGGIPDHHAMWWPVLMLLPLVAGALVGWSVRKIDDDPVARLRTVGVAGAIVGFGCVVLGTLAGGRLGHGPFDPVSVPVGIASVVAFAWIVIPGCFVAFFAGPHSPPAAPSEVMGVETAETDETAEEPETAEATDELEEPEATEESEATEDAEDVDEAETPEVPEAIEKPEEAEEPEEPEEPEADEAPTEPEPAEAVTETTEESDGESTPAPADQDQQPDR